MIKTKGFIQGIGRYFRLDIYRRLLPYVRQHTGAMLIVVLITVLQSGLNLLDPWPMQILVDNGLSRQPLPDWLRQYTPFLASSNAGNIIVFAVIAGLVLRLVGNALTVAGDYLKSLVNETMILRYKSDLFSHLQHLSFSYHDQTSVGDSMYRLDNDTSFISTLIWGSFRHLLTSTMTLVGILWIMVRIDWQLALLALAAGPIIYGSVGYYSKHFKNKSKKVKQIESEAETVVQEVLTNLRVVKAFGMEKREQRRFERQSWRALRARLRLSLEQSIFSSVMGFVTKIDRTLILLIGAFHVLGGRLSVGELLVILSYIGQIHAPLEDIGQTLTDMQISLASAERTLEVLDVKPEIRDKPRAKTLAQVQGAFTFEDVRFCYGTRRVLHDINFTVRPGEVVAIVGPTGAGKTTLANLIARFYDPASGCITLDGYDLRDLTIKTLRDNIAIVTQEPILFTGSIRENIAYGRPSATIYEVEEAAKAANAHHFISALIDGYASPVGERGMKLSGGERQRIAIARAFLKNAPVLILDEPTAALDARTEQGILDALDRLMEDRTTFIIAHRLSTIRHSDQILVIDKGTVAERGTHAQLLARNGLYAQLYRIQTSGLRHRVAEPA